MMLAKRKAKPIAATMCWVLDVLLRSAQAVQAQTAHIRVLVESTTGSTKAAKRRRRRISSLRLGLRVLGVRALLDAAPGEQSLGDQGLGELETLRHLVSLGFLMGP
jgi:hypothetical protein